MNSREKGKRVKRKSPLKRNKPLRKMSKKRKAENAIYLKLRARFLEQNKFCEFPEGICVNRSTDVHYGKGRIGRNLLDETFWWALCREHYRWVHDHGKEARIMGMILEP